MQTTTILTAIITAVISALITYFIKSVAEKVKIRETENQLREFAMETVKKHEQIHHRDEVVKVVDKAVENHEKHCPAPQKIEILFNELRAVRDGIMFLVVKNGGNPKDYGL